MYAFFSVKEEMLALTHIQIQKTLNSDCAKSKVCLNQALLRRLGAAGELLL